MTVIGTAHIKVVRAASRVLTLLEEILATLKRIEEQGERKPQTPETNIVINSTLDEENIRRIAERSVFWRVSGTGQAIKRQQSRAKEEKALAEDFIAKVEQAPEGEAVGIEPTTCGRSGGCNCG